MASMRRCALFVGLLGLLLAPSAQAIPVTVQYIASSSGTLTGYLADAPLGTGVPLGTQIFQTATAGATAIGTFTMNTDTFLDFHVAAADVNPLHFNDGADSDMYIEATFTAPGGYVWSQSGDQFFRSKAYVTGDGWPPSTTGGKLLPQKWATAPPPSFAVDTSARPALKPASAGTSGSAYAAGTERIWRLQSGYNTVNFIAEATLVQGAWKLYDDPTNPGDVNPNLRGLSAQVVRTNSGIGTLALADAAMNLRPGATDYSVAQTFSGLVGDIGSEGKYDSSAGQLPGNHQTTLAGPENYAVKLAGYIRADANEIRTFAVSGDDEFYFRVGATEFLRQGSATEPYIAAIQFMKAGYFPLTLMGRNLAGAQGLEISVSKVAAIVPTWSLAAFDILGTGSYPVYQNPSAVANPADLGANHAGDPLYEGSLGGREIVNTGAVGFRVQQARPAIAPGSVADAAKFYADKVIGKTKNGDKTDYNVGAVETRGTMAMQDSGGFAGANFTDEPMPINGTGSSDNYVTRINALIHIPVAGQYAFTNSSGDGFKLRVGDLQLGGATGGATAAGRANYMYGYFPQAGLYPFEYYQYAGTGGSGLEIAHGGSTSLLLPSANPAAGANGFTVNWRGDPGDPNHVSQNRVSAYVVEPVAQMRANALDLVGKAYGYVPALDMAVAPESWKVEKLTPASPAQPGLLGQYYHLNPNNLTGGDANVQFTTVQGTRNAMNQYTPTWANLPLTVPVMDLPPGGGADGPDPCDTFASVGAPLGNDDQIAYWRGKINIVTAGNKTFRLSSDDGSRLFIDGSLAVDNGGYHGMQFRQTTLDLAAGEHDFFLSFFERDGGSGIYLDWDPLGGSAWQFIDPSLFTYNLQEEVWTVIAEGTGMVGDLFDEGLFKSFPMDFEQTYDLRLTVNIAGLTAIYNLNDVLFVPEPATMVLLGGGLLALARRRRNRR